MYINVPFLCMILGCIPCPLSTNVLSDSCYVIPLFVIGGVREAAPGEDKQDVINEAGKQEIPLTLVNKFEGLAQDDSSDMRALFVRYVHCHCFHCPCNHNIKVPQPMMATLKCIYIQLSHENKQAPHMGL